MKRVALIFCLLGMLVVMTACGGGGGGGGTSNVSPDGDPSAPTTPTGLATVTVAETQITLDWNASSDNGLIVGYKVAGGAAGTVTTISPGYSFTGLTPDTQYCFTVQAIDDDGNMSSASSTKCAKTLAPVDQPWQTVLSGLSDSLTSMVWDGSRLVAAADVFGFDGIMYMSSDGVQWDTYPATDAAFFGNFRGAEKMVYTGSAYVAMDFGYSYSVVYSSVDGIAWEQYINSDPGESIMDFDYSPELNLFVAVGEYGRIVTSPDAKNWSVISDPSLPSPQTSTNLYGVQALGGRLYALGDDDTILISDDGNVWSVVNEDVSSYSSLKDIAWNGVSGPGCLYVAVGYSNVYTSTDGTTWIKQAGAPLGINDTVVWGGGAANCFVTVGLGNHIYSSFDGVTWTKRFVTTDVGSAQNDLYVLVWTGSFFAASGDKGAILTSPDGVDWTVRASGNSFNGVRYVNGEFVAVGDAGRIAYSADGLSWGYRYAGHDALGGNDIAYDGSTYLIAGQAYMLRSDDNMQTWRAYDWGNNSVIWDNSRFLWANGADVISWDGVTYTEPNAYSFSPDWKWSNPDGGRALHWDGSVYVAVGWGGEIFTSATATADYLPTNATSWTARTNAAVTTSDLNAVTKGPGRHVAVGSGGTVITSDDGGSTWVARNSGFGSALYDVAWTGTDYVAVGYGGAILTSNDGISWSIYDHGGSDLYGVAAGNGEVIVVGAKGRVIRRNAP